ncbi:hypothetical protein [Streptomyces sp. NPDC000410]
MSEKLRDLGSCIGCTTRGTARDERFSVEAGSQVVLLLPVLLVALVVL